MSIIKGGAFFYFISMQQEQELYRKRRGHEGPLKKESKVIWRVRRKRRLACTPTDEKKTRFSNFREHKKKAIYGTAELRVIVKYKKKADF